MMRYIMKNRSVLSIIILSMAMSIMTICAMEKGTEPFLIESLPEEIIVQILAQRLQDALAESISIKEFMQQVAHIRLVSKQFNRLVQDEHFLKSLVNNVVAKFNVNPWLVHQVIVLNKSPDIRILTLKEIYAEAEKLDEEAKERFAFVKKKRISGSRIKRALNGKFGRRINPKTIDKEVVLIRNQKDLNKLRIAISHKFSLEEIKFMLQVGFGFINLNSYRYPPDGNTLIAELMAARKRIKDDVYKAVATPEENQEDYERLGKISALIIKYGANPLIPNNKGQTALDIAYKSNDKSMIDVFKQYGWIGIGDE